MLESPFKNLNNITRYYSHELLHATLKNVLYIRYTNLPQPNLSGHMAILGYDAGVVHSEFTW